MIVYGWDGSKYVTKWGTTNIGQGYGALAWLTADVDGDGKTEIIQPWGSSPADGMLAAGSDGLQNEDGAGNGHCDVRLVRNGPVTTFSTGNGIIGSQAQFDAVMNEGGNVEVVNQINWCSAIKPNIVGCGQTPGQSFAVVRIAQNLEGVQWAHEFGHNQGLQHVTGANRVMR